MYKIDKLTLRDLLLGGYRHYTNLPALAWVEGESLTYGDLARHAAVLSRELKRRGFRRGDKIAILSENRPEWGVAYLAITASGLVAVPILTDFTTEQIDNIVEHSETRAVVASRKMSSKLTTEGKAFDLLYVEDALAGYDAVASADPEMDFRPVEEDELACIIYTSGTTGNSKGVMLTHKNIVWDALATRSIIELGEKDIFLSVLPLAHSYESTIGFVVPLLQGCSIRYLDRPPSASVLMPALEKVRPTVMLAVPLLMEKIFRGKIKPELEKHGIYKSTFGRRLLHFVAGRKLMKSFGGRIRFFGVGGAALAPDTELFLREARFPYAIGYGLTETAPLIAGCGPFKTRLRSTGPALRGVELRIAVSVPETGEGEIQARGENVMRGYYKDPERTAEAFTEDGWFRTGDLGIFDNRMRLYIRGRLKTMILGPSGENIYPEEIEAIINQSEPVLESLVYGDGSGLTALVHLKPEVIEEHMARMKGRMEDIEQAYRDTLESIRREVNARLASFSRISKVVLQREPFEKTPTQKIKRFFYPMKGAQPTT